MAVTPFEVAVRAIPPVALVVTVVAWMVHDLGGLAVAVIAVLLIAVVLVAVHHAEVVAHRVGEPFGSLVLAVAVTVIEVGLILSLMSAGGIKAETLARDTVYAAVIITCAGIVGLSLLVATLGAQPIVHFNSEGSGAALATVAALATLTLVMPTVTTSTPGPTSSTVQLVFAGIASLGLYLLFVFVQTVRHRDYFMDKSPDVEHAEAPTNRETAVSLILLLTALVAVVGLAKLTSPTIEAAVLAVGLPVGFVGVIIAIVVLLPESLAAVRAARRDRLQTSMNLALGSAMASIGLTIPVIALSQIWLPVQLKLGLAPSQIVLLALTMFVATLTVTPGRATLQQAGVHLAIFGAFIALSISP